MNKDAALPGEREREGPLSRLDDDDDDTLPPPFPFPPLVRVAFASLFAEPFLSEQDPLAVPLLVRFLLLVGREERREVRPRDELQPRQGLVFRVEVLLCAIKGGPKKEVRTE